MTPNAPKLNDNANKPCLVIAHSDANEDSLLKIKVIYLLNLMKLIQ